MATVASAGAAGLVGAGALLRRPTSAASPPDRPIATATVTRQDLVDIRTVSGKLGHGRAQPVVSRMAGTVTALPSVGETIERGKTLFRLNDEPVILLFGALPAYRALTAGQPEKPGDGTTPPTPAVLASRGADVKQFKENLRALGYALSKDDIFGEQTAAVVRRWQRDLGLPQTGTVELGRVYYAAGPVRIAEHKLAVGAEATGAVVTVTGTARMVTATVKVHDGRLAQPGTQAKIETSGGRQFTGTVTTLSTPDDESAGGQDPVLEATLTIDDPATVSEVDGGPVRVMFTAQERKGVLVVPVGALVALAEGGFGLQVLDGPSPRYVAVTAGLFANGRVEVSGAGIGEGMTVGMAQ